MNRRKYGFEPDYAVLPGDTLQEVMVSLDMTQKELAARTELSEQSLIRIFRGDQPISFETANRLELTTGVPAGFWNRLEAQYGEQKAKLAERQRLEADIAWLKSIPVKELVQRKQLPDIKDKTQMLRNVLAFYGVNSVSAWHEIWEKPQVAARRSTCFETDPGAASAWLRQGEILAHKVVCEPFDKAAFRSALIKIRSLTRSEDAIPRMQELCASCGVAVVTVAQMAKVPWSGATRWLSSDKAMIIMSLRGKREDKFWFSFFHEAGHVLNDPKKNLYIADGSDDPREVAANDFAEEYLIPRKFNARLAACKSHDEVSKLAGELEIAPGIVAGRFQHLTKKWNQFHRLIRTT